MFETKVMPTGTILIVRADTGIVWGTATNAETAYIIVKALNAYVA